MDELNSESLICNICGCKYQGEANDYINVCKNCAQEASVVDNFDTIKDILKFKTSTSFYWVQVLKRRKDNPSMHGDSKVYGSYYIYSYEELVSLKPELIKLSKTFNARVVIWVNSRNMSELLPKMASAVITYIENESVVRTLPNVFQHVCGSHAEKNSDKLYITDVDTKDPKSLNKVCSLLTKAGASNPKFQIRKVIPTVKGYHILSTGFNRELFKQLLVIDRLDPINVLPDQPTLLYFCPQ